MGPAMSRRSNVSHLHHRDDWCTWSGRGSVAWRPGAEVVSLPRRAWMPVDDAYPQRSLLAACCLLRGGRVGRREAEHLGSRHDVPPLHRRRSCRLRVGFETGRNPLKKALPPSQRLRERYSASQAAHPAHPASQAGWIEACAATHSPSAYRTVPARPLAASTPTLVCALPEAVPRIGPDAVIHVRWLLSQAVIHSSSRQASSARAIRLHHDLEPLAGRLL